MKKKISIGVLVFLAVFLIYVGLQPADYKISREISIKATPETLFPYLNNSKKANEWMPWIESDPKLQMQYSGPDEGLGSKSSWESTGQMGSGQALVIESIPNQSVKTQLISQKPMPMEQLAEISLSPNADSTIVRWTVTGKNNFVGRLFCVFMNMDKMVGSEFEKGLAKLKIMTEH